MQAIHHIQQSQSQQAEAARLLLEANEAYRESNRPAATYQQRVQARTECQRLLLEALALAPREPAALGLLGRVALDEGRLDDAKKLFLHSLNINDQQPQQYCNLGYWALATERPVLAEQYFLEALELDRQSAAAFCGVAHAKRSQGQFDVAFLHYRKLLQLGLSWPSIYSGMLTCAEHLNVDKADEQLAQDAIALLKRDELPHQQIGRFVASIIRQQYDLDNPEAQILLEQAAGDELLILALENTLMPDPAVEQLVVQLRRAVTADVALTAELREELQALTIALARYADRTGYVLATEFDEDTLVNTLNDSIAAQLVMGDAPEHMVASVMVSCLYGALFHQPFAAQLGRWNLVDWPAAVQPLLADSYYHRASEEAVKQSFAEKAAELSLDKVDVPQAWPSWSQLAYQTATSLKAIIAGELGLVTEQLPDTLRIMVCGAESGQRALELARYLDDVEVLAVDESLANIARATRRAEELGLDNIVFWPWSLAQQFIADGNTVQWIEVGRLPSARMTETSLAALVNAASHQGSVVHLHTAMEEQTQGDQQIHRLINEHNLQPTRTNVRRLRRMALNNPKDPMWVDLLAEPGFYGLGGCQDRWFRPQDSAQLHDLMALMGNEVDWKLQKARDSDGQTLATGPVQKQLQAQAHGDQVQSLLGQGLSVYFVKRR
ncbi:hypothetical protein [Marinobacter sp. X15-166B]|uniref:hypothetical protein n=1 Tax=Marinobacter sp. X15-166B TaxID=1897620 RepID=UPI00085C896E|nr:hypothetical protein [Marinobacter sp. X15-166B]OEY65138.1 hypothetical protein BG841_00765 [Marinobacter sp. X15-166B]